MTQPMTSILLSDVDVLKFKLFMQHYDMFTTLLDAEALNQKNANITLSFDYLGCLQKIKREDVLFIRKKFANENKE